MDVGLAIFLTGDVQHPAELAQRAEAAGYESLMLTEHTHIPVSAGMVARDGGPLAEHYRRTHDPFVALALRRRGDREARHGHERLPGDRARSDRAGQADRLAAEPVRRALRVRRRRRLEQAEMLNHGTDPATRHGNMRERVEAMKAIWTQDEAEYHGKHVDFDPIWQWPKPDPMPPVLIGGNGPRVEDRVLRYGDGWMPNMKELETLEPRIDALRERAGRHVPVTYYGARRRTWRRWATPAWTAR